MDILKAELQLMRFFIFYNIFYNVKKNLHNRFSSRVLAPWAKMNLFNTNVISKFRYSDNEWSLITIYTYHIISYSISLKFLNLINSTFANKKKM